MTCGVGLIMMSVRLSVQQCCTGIRLDFIMRLRTEIMLINDSWVTDIRSIWRCLTVITKYTASLRRQHAG